MPNPLQAIADAAKKRREERRAARRHQAGIADLASGKFGDVRGSEIDEFRKQNTPLGDQAPTAPSLTEDPTGITGVGGGETVAELGQELVGGLTDVAEQQFESDEARFAAAQELKGDVEADVDEAMGLTDAALAEQEADRERLVANLETAGEEIAKIPGAVDDTFEALKAELDTVTSASFDRIEGQEADALANAERGRSEAMQAAVQGIQGQVGSAIDQIMSNPNLTQAQKQSMVAKVKIQGATSIAPAIGATVLEFNKVSADIATKFGAITGALEGVGVQAKAGLLETQGSVYAQTQIAVGQMTNQLLEIDANASASYASSQAQLLGVRNQMVMAGHQVGLALVPEMGTPVFDPTNAQSAALEIGMGISSEQARRKAADFVMEMTVQMLREDQGTWMSNLFEDMWGGLTQFGPSGAGAALGANILENIFNPQQQQI